jgi:hypothetical protein
MGFALLIDYERTTVERGVKNIVDKDPDRNNDCNIIIVRSNFSFKLKPALTVISVFSQSIGHDSEFSSRQACVTCR